MKIKFHFTETLITEDEQAWLARAMSPSANDAPQEPGDFDPALYLEDVAPQSRTVILSGPVEINLRDVARITPVR